MVEATELHWPRGGGGESQRAESQRQQRSLPATGLPWTRNEGACALASWHQKDNSFKAEQVPKLCKLQSSLCAEKTVPSPCFYYSTIEINSGGGWSEARSIAVQEDRGHQARERL